MGQLPPSGLAEYVRRWGVLTIVLIAVLVRLAVIVPSFGKLDDPDRYLVVARSLADGEGFAVNGLPTAYRPPLYPLLLSVLITMLGEDRLAWGVAGLHLVAGAGTVVLTAVAARRWGLPPGRLLLAAAIVAFDPVLVAQSRAVMTETLAAFLVAATLAALAEGHARGAFWGGIGFGLASLCRPSLLPAAGLVVFAALATGPGTAWVRLRRASLVAVATVMLLVPWAWRNAWVFGESVWTTTHGGWTLALANNPVYYAEVLDGPPGAVWSGANQKRWFDETVHEVEGLSQPRADRKIRTMALRFIRDHPRDFVRASVARLERFWGFAPAGAVYSRAIRGVTLLWTVPLWIALALGLTTRRDLWRWPGVAAPAVVLALTAVHSIYWTDMRMRAPIVPAIALIAVGAQTSLLSVSRLREIHASRSVN
ncbi:ArnT family glycosyltransferase [Singulisphaera acidiphila]|uniref:Putative membrane-bound dolichyl-phosphate-mannose-protein mannosyltransferase n=1 Tax=Singulisphaera acidiphila (strain ATCC BAA-1392 / DSM 18658 / VKM B-2454 / MOB10) TaxID=886293 RepID=L0DF49_SINAD|nr:phospholipid carrier-dependent glycosyltransferase [Singulisphaera acidiphila]AGA27438.1 putative membrane-bound dolichyl-phosphate-mannose-protein mannosyltransferase [Singulisphaera acidiphila DSM 18658]